jgi:hypothetical protein
MRRVLFLVYQTMLAAAFALAACSRDAPEPTPTGDLFPTPTDIVTLGPTPTPMPYVFIDANSVVSGICFESAYDAAGRTFVLRSAGELERLFDLADNSQFCREPVGRAQFDFSGPRAIIGTWTRGRGCTADHEIVSVEIDEVSQIFVIRARLVVAGDCNYELVRPLWIGLTGYNDYDLRLLVED